MDIEAWLADERVPWIAGGAAVLVVLVLLVSRGRAGARRNARRRAGKGLADRIRRFRDDLKRAAAAAEPVFRKIEAETARAAVIGHGRKTLGHRIGVTAPDFGALKDAARGLGIDFMPISELEAAWRGVGRAVADYDAGRLDASPTPIATLRSLEKDLRRMVLLANLCLQKVEGAGGGD